MLKKEVHFYFFISKKTKAATGDILWKKHFLKNLANFTGKHLCWSLFLMKLQVFKNTYFEKHLWTTASKKTNICLIVEVLLLRRIKLLNSNVNKKKNHVRKFDVRSHMTRDCRRQASLLTYPLCGFNKTPEGAIPSHSCPGLFSQW